ncbi:MAG: hypothetical protein KF832_11780 [Caldilineaceae bacterium]|nr:hypothetical protein [Caldilineaceae bacterium]
MQALFPSSFQRWLRLLLSCLPLLLVQCARVQSTESAALPLDDALPNAWTALRAVQEVNIDGDEATEYLLFFVYDALSAGSSGGWLSTRRVLPNGPVGAVIYDAQVLTGTLTSEQVSPDKPTTALVPYAILPSYRRNTGQGFIAAPGQGEGVQAYPVSYRSLTDATNTAADTLLFLAGAGKVDTYLTFVWWQNRAEGYGVTQLYAPGGFESALYSAFGWSQWQRTPQPIQQLIAVHPVHDRNLLCRRFQYTLTDTTGAPPVHYQKSDLGLTFCDRTPPHPFYPEGVVLAYLLEGKATLLDANATMGREGEGLGWLQQQIQAQQILRVDDLASYATLTTTEPPFAALPPDTIGVCALLTLVSADATAKQSALFFQLRHQPAGFQPPTPDQLFITNVETIPAPNEHSVVNCHEQLGG